MKLTTIQPRLQAERFAVERAMEALTAAKAEMRRINAISGSLIDTAVRIGDLFGYAEISDFANQDDAWLFTIEGLVTAFRARGELGKQVAERFTEVLAESRAIPRSSPARPLSTPAPRRRSPSSTARSRVPSRSVAPC